MSPKTVMLKTGKTRKSGKVTSRKKYRFLADILKEKKALDIVILDMRRLHHFYDYFVICSADSERQARAIFDAVLCGAKKEKIPVHHIEEDKLCRWLLIDFFDVVLHIFDSDTRKFYALERVWKEARRVKLSLQTSSVKKN